MTGPEDERPLPALRDRRLSGAEVEEILRRSALAEIPLGPPPSEGLTVDELAAAAAEAGLDPAAVRRAAAVVPPAPGGVLARLLGGPDRRRASAFLEGARIPVSPHALARAAEAGLGVRGEVREGPGRFHWRARGAGGETTVSVIERAGGAEVAVDTRRGAHYVGLWLLGLGGWAALSALTPLGGLGPLGFAASFVLVPVLLARPFWARADRKLRERLERTALELARVIEEGGNG